MVGGRVGSDRVGESEYEVPSGLSSSQPATAASDYEQV